MNKTEMGILGEDIAVRMLELKGYKIIHRNYRCQWGEVDIIAEKDSEISFIEVKARRNYSYGRPCEAVDLKKQKHIRNTAISYLREKDKGRIFYRKINFDVVEIVIEHIKNAF